MYAISASLGDITIGILFLKSPIVLLFIFVLLCEAWTSGVRLFYSFFRYGILTYTLLNGIWISVFYYPDLACFRPPEWGLGISPRAIQCRCLNKASVVLEVQPKLRLSEVYKTRITTSVELGDSHNHCSVVCVGAPEFFWGNRVS